MIGSLGEAARGLAVKIPQTARTAARSDDAIDRAPLARAVAAGSIIALLLARDFPVAIATSVLCPDTRRACRPYGGSPKFPFSCRSEMLAGGSFNCYNALARANTEPPSRIGRSNGLATMITIFQSRRRSQRCQ